MTARAARAVATRPAGLRVIGGRRPVRPQVGPFVVFGIVVIASMLGIVMARTSLDAGAFQLTELNDQIAAETERQALLTLEIAQLESPTRIGPLAEQMGLVHPDTRTVLLVDGIGDDLDPDLLVEADSSNEVAAPAIGDVAVEEEGHP
jgi:cell division protein FtsL